MAKWKGEEAKKGTWRSKTNSDGLKVPDAEWAARYVRGQSPRSIFAKSKMAFWKDKSP